MISQRSLSASTTPFQTALAIAASRFMLHRKEKVLRELPFGMEPLLGAAVSGPFAHANHFLWIVFVRTLRPNCFILAQVDAEAGLADGDALPGGGAEMHLDAPLRCAVAHHVFETREIKIGPEFAIDPRQQVLVECGGDTGGIIVSKQQPRHGLLE